MDLCVKITGPIWADKLVEYAFFSMQTYLTDVWGLSFTRAAAILNIWGAITWILPLFFLFLSDARIGHFKIIVITSIANSVGIVLVTMSTPPVLANLTGTCKENKAECIGETQIVMFYTGMALLAVGIGGHRASLKPFLSEHDDFPEEDVDDEFYSTYVTLLFWIRLPLVLFVSLTTMAAFFAFPYLKQWYLLFGVTGICVVFTTLLFFTGWNGYHYSKPQGSPLSDVCRVFVAAARKISQPLPADTNLLYTNDDKGRNSFPSSRFLWCLEKAAIVLPDQSVEDQVRNRWKLCSIEQVEATKFVLRVIPIGTTFVMCTIVSSIGNTYLVEQGSNMNRSLGKWKVPSQVLLALFYLVKKLLFDKLAEWRLRKSGPPQVITVAMTFSVLCCVTAAVIEMERHRVVERRGLLNKPDAVVPMSAYWLFFPFFLLAGLDSFFKKGVVAFYETGSPRDMKRYCGHFMDTVSGLGLVYSLVSVYVVGKISEIGGGQNWFQESLNKSRLDRYYWVLGGLSGLNLLIFVLLASLHKYQNWSPSDGDEAYNPEVDDEV